MVALCATIVVGSLNTATLGPFIPDIADDMNRSVALIGQAATAFLVVAALGGLVIGPLADHYGYRPILFVGLALTALSAVAGGLAPNFPVLVLTRLVGGLGMASTIGIVFAVASSRYDGRVRLRALSILTGSFALTGIVGIPVLTGLSAWIGWRGAWIFVGLLTFVAVLAYASFGPEEDNHRDGRFALATILGNYRTLLGSRRMVLFFTGSAFQGALFVAAFTYHGAYFIDELGLTVPEFGFIAAFGSATFAAGSFLAGKLGGFDRRFLFGATTMAAGLFLAPGYLDLTGVVSSTGFISASFFLAGLGAVSLMDLLAEYTPAGQATTLVFNESVFSVGAAFGAAAGGIAISLGGFDALALMLPVIGLAGGFLVWRPAIPGLGMARAK